jgi:hypothetical protein
MPNSLLTERLKVTQYDFDPDATTATDIAWVDMSNCDRILISFFRTIGTADLTFTVLGNSASNGGGSDVTIKTVTLTGVQPNAVGDYTFVEVSRDEMVAASEDIRYISANCTVATGTDEAVITYIREMMTAVSGNTANNIA